MYWIILLLLTAPDAIPSHVMEEPNRGVSLERLHGRLEDGLNTCSSLDGCGFGITLLALNLHLWSGADTNKLTMDESLQNRMCNVAVATAFRTTGNAVESGIYLDKSNPWGIGVPPDLDHVHRALLDLLV